MQCICCNTYCLFSYWDQLSQTTWIHSQTLITWSLLTAKYFQHARNRIVPRLFNKPIHQREEAITNFEDIPNNAPYSHETSKNNDLCARITIASRNSEIRKPGSVIFFSPLPCVDRKYTTSHPRIETNRLWMNWINFSDSQGSPNRGNRHNRFQLDEVKDWRAAIGNVYEQLLGIVSMFMFPIESGRCERNK